MMRIGSDLLPLYTVPEATAIYSELMPDLQPLLARCGEFARAHNIRLSFHPGQYSVLASDNEGVWIGQLRMWSTMRCVPC